MASSASATKAFSSHSVGSGEFIVFSATRPAHWAEASQPCSGKAAKRKKPGGKRVRPPGKVSKCSKPRRWRASLEPKGVRRRKVT